MLLKVGELAKRTGLTVRTLHHYDSIGLLQPSARSDSGYRLYDPHDVARLHGIQALRGLGLALEDIGRLLADEGASLPGIVDRQLRALALQIEQASALRHRLELVQAKFASGGEPELDDWLATLQLMTTCAKYFSPAELKAIFDNWASVEPQWQALAADVRAVMVAGIPPLDAQVQPLAQRWMVLMHGWMQGNFDVMMRWGRMYTSEPGVQGQSGLDLALVNYIEQAVQLRVSLLMRYISEDEMRRMGHVSEAEWRALAQAVQAAQDAGATPESAAGLALARRWLVLTDRLTAGDTDLRDRLQRAHEAEPLLRAGGMLPPGPRAFLVQARAALAATA